MFCDNSLQVGGLQIVYFLFKKIIVKIQSATEVSERKKKKTCK